MMFRTSQRAVPSFLIFAALLVIGGQGCVSGAQVKAKELPVKKVVVYRNGVAYFERGGEVDTKQVEFQVHEESIGDFLASLSVMEAGGSSLRSASFPVELEPQTDETSQEPLPIAPVHDVRDVRNDTAPPVAAAKARPSISTVTLQLDGEKHDLTVGYIAPTPLWRPSYRLVADEKGALFLQVWGIVQNQSGEDWQDVELALVSGSPLSFQSTLEEPFTPARPILEDNGDVTTAIVEGTRRLQESEEVQHAPMPRSKRAMRKSSRMPRSLAETDYQYSVEDDPLLRGSYDDANSSFIRPQVGLAVAQAEAQQGQGGSSRFLIPQVTIPDQSATMVLLGQANAEGALRAVYRPDPGVPRSSKTPFLMAEFENHIGAHLDRGPLSVFDQRSFVGQGVLPAIARDAAASIPVGFSHGVEVEVDKKSREVTPRLSRIVGGAIYVQGFEVLTTHYQVQNGQPDDLDLVIAHPRRHNMDLVSMPESSDKKDQNGERRFRLSVQAQGKAEASIEERRQRESRMQAFDRRLEKMLTASLKEQLQPADQLALADLLKSYQLLFKTLEPQAQLQAAKRNLEGQARQVRLSLQSIKGNSQASKLRKELTQQLSELVKQLESIARDLLQLEVDAEKIKVQITQKLKTLEISLPKAKK